jgi:two-component system, response regulator PdtaR
VEPLILIVDDDESLRLWAAATLQAAGYPILQAADANDAVKLLEQHPTVSMLFTDIIMPGMDGFALADLAVRRWPGLRVLYTTTREKLRDADNQPGLLHGIILLKPYRGEELAAAIEKTLIRPAPEQRP